jgi:hypothetical protein
MSYLILFEIFSDNPAVQDPHFATQVTLALIYSLIGCLGAVYGRMTELGGWRGAWRAVRNTVMVEILIIVAIIVFCMAFEKGREISQNKD